MIDLIFVNVLLTSLISFINSQCIPLESSSLRTSSSKVRIVDGDIAIIEKGEDSYRLLDDQPTKVEIQTWLDGIIPYEFHSSITDNVKSVIDSAINYWEEQTCIRFRLRNETDRYWITFRSDSTGCYSFVGRDPSCRGQGQPISLSGRGCQNLLVAIHELGHVVGLRHQHNRPDRDDYVRIIWKNLMSGSQWYFKKELYDTFNVPYDYTSIMHYKSWHFSRDIMNRSSMVAIDPRYQRFLGRSNGLSFRDRKTVDAMYECRRTTNCVDVNLNCLNDGFVIESDGSCVCHCPPNTTGERCEIVLHEDYYESQDPLNCGGLITMNGSHIETPNLTETQSLNCVWTIRAPNNISIQLKFLNFSMTSRIDINRVYDDNSTRPPNYKCFNESLEIRLKDRFDGDFFCGEDIKPGQVMTSESPQVILIVTSSVLQTKSHLVAKFNFVRNEAKQVSAITTTKRPNNRQLATSWSPFPVDIFGKLLEIVRNFMIGSKNIVSNV